MPEWIKEMRDNWLDEIGLTGFNRTNLSVGFNKAFSLLSRPENQARMPETQKLIDACSGLHEEPCFIDAEGCVCGNFQAIAKTLKPFKEENKDDNR